MKKRLFLFLTLLTLSFLASMAQPPCGQPPCGGGGGGGPGGGGKPCAQPPCVPIDQGLGLLLAGGVVLGFFAYKKASK